MADVDFSNVTSIAIDDGQVKSLSVDGIEIWSEPIGIDYLCFTAEEANSTIKLNKWRTPTGDDFQYSIDKKNWTKYSGWGNETITLTNVGDKVYFKGNNPNGISSDFFYDYIYFSMTGNIAASGNIMTLIDESGNAEIIPGGDCFSNMFENCTSLTTTPELPATTLTEHCYYGMFSCCTSLTTVPALPATTLANNCYQGMFYGCTSLTTAPALPATTLTNECYKDMFYACTSLTTIPALPATTLTNECCETMFAGCDKIKMSEIQSEEYPNKYEFGTTPGSYYANCMFRGTGGSFTGTPTQKIYYTANEIV